MDAVKQASPKIDRQFRDVPEVAARLHQAIARALDNRTNYGDARREYDRAAALFLRTDGPLSQDAIIVNLLRTAMEARTYQEGACLCACAAETAGIAAYRHFRPARRSCWYGFVGARDDCPD